MARFVPVSVVTMNQIPGEQLAEVTLDLRDDAARAAQEAASYSKLR